MADIQTPKVRRERVSRFSHCSVDLQKSVQKLDETLSDQKSFLRGTNTTPKSTNYRRSFTMRGLTFDDSVAEDENMSWMPSKKPNVTAPDSSSRRMDFETSMVMNTSKSLSATLLEDEEQTLRATNVLYGEFLETIRNYPAEHQFSEMILGLRDSVREQASNLKCKLKKQLPGQNRLVRTYQSSVLLQDESNTWQLVHDLFNDRWKMETEQDSEAMIVDSIGKRLSDREICDNLFKRDAQVRQCQIVIDWLEKNASVTLLDEGYEKVEYFVNQGSAGENTLNRLKNKSANRFGLSSNLVSEIDPDAPIRQNKQLDDLDREGETHLLKYVFAYLRSGQLDEAQKLCVRYGEPWRAATLEGWKVLHDPNYTNPPNTHLAPIEGNGYRVIWKSSCWHMCADELIPAEEKAIYGTLTGNLKSILPACHSWEDYLWAYCRVMVDVHVEQELRSDSMQVRSFEQIPQAYWEKMLTLDGIFLELQACPNDVVKNEAQQKYHIIQKCIILDDIAGLVEEMYAWIKKPTPLPHHLVRFMAHLVLFFRKLGRSCKEELCNAILEAYVKNLIEDRYVDLVAPYTAYLPKDSQIQWYAKFLEGIIDRNDREYCLQLGTDSDLDVAAITKLVVENIRNKESDDVTMRLTTAAGSSSGSASGKPETDIPVPTNEGDLEKIDVIDWLFFDVSQRGEALIQANALMRTFLASNKLDAARAVFAKIPRDTVAVISQLYRTVDTDELPTDEENAIREYMCIDTYLQCLESYSDWFEHYHNRPEAPQIVAGATFTERVAFEHEEKEYRADLERWQNALRSQTKMTVDLLYNVLLFADGGWMCDVTDGDSTASTPRKVQMQRLRELCIPKIAFLLTSVLQDTEQDKDCLQLANIIASEQHGLYKVFRRDQLQKLLQNIRNSSLAILTTSSDPLGYPSS